MAEDSSGWVDVHARDWRKLDTAAQGRRALEKARVSAQPQAVPAGKYTVVLEENAVAELVAFLGWTGFGAQSYQEGHSFLNGRLGQKVTGDHITIVDDAFDARTLGMPFDFEGVPKKKVTLIENGAKFQIDPLEGQKTGWFYDQRDSRAFVARLCGGAKMLDAYCYGGGFGIAAAMAGAASVTLLDRSAGALEAAMRSAALNRVADRCMAKQQEVFTALDEMAAKGERFDVVVIDPPAFAKSRKDIPQAIQGYRKLVRQAAGLVVPNGILFAASCSHNVGVPEFAEAVARGLQDARRTGRILRQAGAGPDHPVHPQLPESAYLKSLTLALD